MLSASELKHLIATGDLQGAQRVQKKGNINIKEIRFKFERTLLHEVLVAVRKASSGKKADSRAIRIEMLKWLLDEGITVGVGAISIDAKDKYGDTPLHRAAQYNYSDCILLLIKNQASLTETNNQGYNALHIAASRGYSDSVEVLLKEGAKPNETTSPCKEDSSDIQRTALHLAVSYKKVGCTDEQSYKDCIEILVNGGANVNAKDSQGYTPLHVAAKKGHAECIKVLIGNGASIDEKDLKGKTPLDIAAEEGHAECIKILKAAIQRSADIIPGPVESVALEQGSLKRTRYEKSTLLLGPLTLFKQAKHSDSASLHSDTQKERIEIPAPLANDIKRNEPTQNDSSDSDDTTLSQEGNSSDSDDITLNQEESIFFKTTPSF